MRPSSETLGHFLPPTDDSTLGRQTHQQLVAMCAGAGHVDSKTIAVKGSLRGFIAGMFAYQPLWLTTLYRVRGGFVRLLGMRQERVPRAAAYSAETLPMTPGQRLGFFTVRLANDRAWVAEADDTHLRALLAVVTKERVMGRGEPQQSEFQVVTIVHYKHWTGPLYFNVIRPFHHLVVWSMMRAGRRSAALHA